MLAGYATATSATAPLRHPTLSSLGWRGSARCPRVPHFPLRAQDRAAGVTGGVAQLFLDADQLVVLREPVRTREAAGFDLAAVGRDREIRDRRVLGLARTCLLYTSPSPRD